MTVQGSVQGIQNHSYHQILVDDPRAALRDGDAHEELTKGDQAFAMCGVLLNEGRVASRAASLASAGCWLRHS